MGWFFVFVVVKLLGTLLGVKASQRERRRLEAERDQLRQTVQELRTTHETLFHGSEDTLDEGTNRDIEINIPKDLSEALNKGQCILFSGTGLSAQAGLPTWTEVLSSIIADSDLGSLTTKLTEYLKEGDHSAVTDVLISKLGRENFIQRAKKVFQTFPEKKIDPVQDTLQSLFFKGVITTAWDTYVDEVFSTRTPMRLTPQTIHKIPDVLRNDDFFIFNLNGRRWIQPPSAKFDLKDMAISTPSSFMMA